MNELLDKLLIRVLLAFFICLGIYLYKYAHLILYPGTKNQMFKKFYPMKNSADTIFLFGRILGIGMIFSQFYFFMSDGVFLALFDFILASTISLILYLGSLYIVDSIVLYSFEYHDEVIKRENLSYSIICFAHAIGLAHLMKISVTVARDNVNHVPIYLIFLWLFTMVIIGFATKTYPLISKFQFNKLLVQKSISLSLSYSGFFLGICLIITSSINHQVIDIKEYVIHTCLQILLSLIILPIFRKGLILVFSFQESMATNEIDEVKEIENPTIGHGIYEGILFLTCCYLTSVITGQLYFGTFYPRF
ncbi:MAG: hypothetical protein ACO20H_09870 [Bacteriovoracaceae bacterium]